jgi:hypothetical protein
MLYTVIYNDRKETIDKIQQVHGGRARKNGGLDARFLAREVMIWKGIVEQSL